jgi:hypothetical protein
MISVSRLMVISAALLTLAVCGSRPAISGNGVTYGNPPATVRPVVEPSACAIYDSGHDVRIFVTSTRRSECSALAASLSRGGDFWTAQPQETSDPLSMVCVMHGKGTVAEVIDGGGQIIGQEACSDFVSSGWTEDTTAEQRARRQEQQQADAQASASASASQAQAQQEQRDQDQQAAQSDLSTLQQDASYTGVLSGDLSSFASDIQTARSDLATEKQDSAGDNSYCSAVESVAGDAESVNGDLESVQGDVESTSPDISAVRQDITSLTGDSRALASDGLPPLPGAAGAIDTARANLTRAITTANSYIDQINTIDAQAYSLADSMATGSCEGDGPGSPTSPIPHI